MDAIKIETWAIDIVQKVLNGKPNEDSLVELKAEWPIDFRKTARQIAGHANVARGESILWIIGVDQKAMKLIGVNQIEVSTWYDKIKAEFSDRIAPSLKDINIPYDNITIVALLFDTERFPFVVKYSDEILETPWREGTLTRSANRFELLKLLSPLQRSPNIEVLNGWVAINQNPNGDIYWNICLDLYIEPKDFNTLVIPFRKCIGSIEFDEGKSKIALPNIRLHPPYGGWRSISSVKHESQNLSKTIEDGPDEIIVHGPGKMILSDNIHVKDIPSNLADIHTLMLSFSMLPTNSERPTQIEIYLDKIASIDTAIDPNQLHKWSVIT